MYYHADVLERLLFYGKPFAGALGKKLFPKHLSHVSRCHYNAIYDSQLQNAIVLRMQLPQGATLTQPFQCDLRTLSYKAQKNDAQRLHKLLRFCSSNSGSRRKNGKTTIFEARFKRNFKRKIINAKMKKNVAKAPFTRLTRPLQ